MKKEMWKKALLYLLKSTV